MPPATGDVMSKWVALPIREGGESLRNLLGREQGRRLIEMTKAGMPVPPGFTSPRPQCLEYYADDRTLPAGLDAQVEAGAGGSRVYL